MNTLDSISPIDGRYRKYTEPLARFFSEEAFMRYRVQMEGEYLISLSEILKTKFEIRNKSQIRNLAANFSNKDAEQIKKLEATTNHDFKAIEYWMREKLNLKLSNWIHFGLTSQDATNIAQALMLRDALQEVIVPALEEILSELRLLSTTHYALPMLARTHGQPASPTTFGKEMAVFVHRLERQVKQLRGFKLTAKLNGATGNYNALVAAYPKIDWIAFSKKFITSLGLEANLITTQIEPYDNQIELFDVLRRINMILIDFDQDMWRYISDGWIVQKAIKGEVGSSTMPHKINPIRFENSEGNLGIANALFQHFALKLPVSRLQRDLSDSTVERTIGTAFGHALVGYRNIIDGLGRIAVNQDAMREELEQHPELLAEAIQTILRREGVTMPYEQLKELTRGKQITQQDITKFIDSLNVDGKTRQELHKLRTTNYTGLASKLATYA
ncbi:MAG: adenylosuccinate lyase [Patescibacteria group bacterium]